MVNYLREWYNTSLSVLMLRGNFHRRSLLLSIIILQIKTLIAFSITTTTTTTTSKASAVRFAFRSNKQNLPCLYTDNSTRWTIAEIVPYAILKQHIQDKLNDRFIELNEKQ